MYNIHTYTRIYPLIFRINISARRKVIIFITRDEALGFSGSFGTNIGRARNLVKPCCIHVVFSHATQRSYYVRNIFSPPVSMYIYIYYACEEKASNLFHPAGFYSIYTPLPFPPETFSYYLVKYTDTDI